MTSAARWGALVVAALPCAPAACSPVPAPAIATTVVAPSPGPAVSAAPLLSDFVEPFPSAPAHGGSSSRVAVTGVRFGRGTFVHQTYRRPNRHGRPCPFARDEGCGSFVLHPTAPATAPADLWPPASVEAPIEFTDDDRNRPGPFVAPHAWVAFAGGRDAVYALREGGKVIDRIDEQGKVSLFAADDAMSGWDELWVIERRDRTFVAGMDGRWRRGLSGRAEDLVPSWQLAEVLSGDPGQARLLGPRTDLPMRVLGHRDDAHGARATSLDGKMTAVRLPELVALPDDGADKDRWAMVWLEVIPPARGAARNRPQRGVSAQPLGSPANRPARRGARHGCAGAFSRSLDDASVTKRAHATFFAGARLLDDQIRWTGAAVGRVPLVRLSPRLDDEQLVVAVPTRPAPGTDPRVLRPGPPQREWFDEDGQPPRHVMAPAWGGADGRVTLRHDEQVTALAYDPDSHEGIVVMRDNNRQFFRGFDASGRPLGEEIEIGGVGWIDQAAKIDGKWLALAGIERTLHDLTGHGSELPRAGVPRTASVHLVSVNGRGLLLHTHEGALLSTPVSAQGVSGDTVKVDTIPSLTSPDTLQVTRLGGETVVSTLEHSGKGHDLMAWRHLTPGASWQIVDLPPRPTDGSRMVEARGLPGDLVVRFIDEREVFALYGDDPLDHTGPGSASREPHVTPGGLWSGPGPQLRLEPGPLRHGDSLVGLGSVCPYAVQTEPGTVVVACARAADPAVASVRVALRTLHVAPAR